MASKTTTGEPKVANGNGTSQVLPWTFTGLAMVGAVVVFVWGQINPKVDIGNVKADLSERISQLEQRNHDTEGALKKDIEEVKRLVDLRLTIAEHNEYKLRVDNELKRIDDVVRMLAQTRVHRQEYERELLNITDRMSALRMVVEKVQADIFGSYNVGKQLDNLQAQQVKQAEITASQIAELRRAIDMRPPAIIPNAIIKPTPP